MHVAARTYHPARGASPAAAASAAAANALASGRQLPRLVRRRRPYDLLVVLDDATSKIYYAQVVEQESTRTVLAGLREVVEDRLTGTYCLSTPIISFRPWLKCLLAAQVPDVSDLYLVQFPRAPRLLE
jgi:hypothetical protein